MKKYKLLKDLPFVRQWWIFDETGKYLWEDWYKTDWLINKEIEFYMKDDWLTRKYYKDKFNEWFLELNDID